MGQANSPFTYTPNIVILDQGAFDAAYPTSEANPRTDYHVFILQDGNLLLTASFCWTKNEVIARFGYDGKEQRFRTLPGSPLTVVGVLAADANTNRLKVTPPVSTDLSSYPIRLSLGSGSGTALTLAPVATDGAFTTPASGTVEVSVATGHLNWAAADITTYLGQSVRFQQQTFFDQKQSNGNIGNVATTLLLNPLPAVNQYPLIRLGSDRYLTPSQVVNDGAFSFDPSPGTVEWSITTGRLKFNSAAISSGKDAFYDGVVFQFMVLVPEMGIGTVNSPATLSPIPDEQSDTYFAVPGVVQFPETVFVDSFSSRGKKGRVEIRRSTGQVRFSLADRNLYGAMTAVVVLPDLPIERGMSLRLF